MKTRSTRGRETRSKDAIAANSKATTASMPRNVDKRRHKSRESKTAIDADSDANSSADEDEYEIERILDMRTKKKNGVETIQYLVLWVGYAEPTWEPGKNLPADVVAAYNAGLAASASATDAVPSEAVLVADPPVSESTRVDRRRADSSSHQTHSTTTPPDSACVSDVLADASVLSYRDEREDGIDQATNISTCATCGEGPEGVGSACIRCKKPMHHFCATDVCQSLSLKDASGADIVEFENDTRYCSKACFNRRVGAVCAAKRKRMRVQDSDDADYSDDKDDGDEEDDDDDDGDGVARKRKLSKTQSKKSPAVHARKQSRSKKVESPLIASPELPRPPRRPKETKQKAKPAAASQATLPRDVRLGKMVAFCADKEDWMPSQLYKEVKGLYLSGRVHRPKAAKGQRVTAGGVYEVRWTVTSYQSKNYVHRISGTKVDEGIANHATLAGGMLNKATWRHICQVPDSEARGDGESLDDYVVLDGSPDMFTSQQVLPANLELVEQISSLDFQPSKQMREPTDLFTHDDGTTGAKLINEKRHHFDTASSSFFAYLPVSFWNTVVNESNKYAAASRGKVITLDEMMRFWGIMFYMTVVDKGEYSNYWGNQVEDEIFGLSSSGVDLEQLMTLKQFQFIRKNLCFRFSVSDGELKRDPAARIRPLINMIKYTSTKYVLVGRNVAVDESSIACRSKYGRHLIVFNSSKPTGKSHFKIYACCCATTWLMVSFRLHCASEMEDRLKDVVSTTEARNLNDRLQFSSNVRQIVLEVTRPLHRSGRIVNTDNFYTSVTLLLSLRDVGMYGRGTIRENSAHFPKAHMFAKKANEPRGSSLQGVSRTGEMLAASWMDGSAVNIISNADASDMGEVTRLIGKKHVAYPAPKCVAEYNKHMQGVDRLDQLRAKYSLADGHSMKKWHKKLALAFIDIARVNAYVTRCMRDDAVTDAKASRNEHRQFMINLASELISGKWKDTVEDEGMLFADDQLSTASIAGSPKAPSPSQVVAPCTFVLSKKAFPNATRGKRGCKVCQFEGRTMTMNTIYCLRHNVCLCTNTYPMNEKLSSVVCPRIDLTCWQKFHEHYLPKGVFNDSGHIKRTSKIFHARQALLQPEDPEGEGNLPARPVARSLSPEMDSYTPAGAATSVLSTPLPSQPVESPPTLVFSPFDGARANAGRASSPLFAFSPHAMVSTPASVAYSSEAFEQIVSPRQIQSTTSSEDYTVVL